MIEPDPPDQMVNVYEKLESGEIAGRVVVLPYVNSTKW